MPSPANLLTRLERPFAAWSAVAVLRQAVGPAAIVWFVIPVVVDAIKRHAGLWFAHIRDKCGHVAPSFAYLDVARPVILIGRMADLSIASTVHITPSKIAFLGASDAGYAVSGDGLNSAASAGKTFPVAKLAVRNRPWRASAGALAFGLGLIPLTSWRRAEDLQAAKDGVWGDGGGFSRHVPMMNHFYGGCNAQPS